MATAAPSDPAQGDSPKSLHRKLKALQPKAIAEPWRVMTLVWRGICAALLPIALRDIPSALDRFLQHLARDKQKCRERRAAVFYRNLQGDSG